MDEEQRMFTVIRFIEPVPDEVIDADAPDTMNPAIIAGAMAGVLERETGRVYPFVSEEAARAAIPILKAKGGEASPYQWEPHYSTEFEEVI